MLLVDSFEFGSLRVLEENRDRGIMRLSGICQRAETPNNNLRKYKKPLLEREFNKLAPSISERRLIGELDHPTGTTVMLKNASHLVTEVYFKGNDAYCEIELLNTPAGKVAQDLIRDGVKLGISSRAVGTLGIPDKNGVMEVNEDLHLITWDLVADPSTKDAFVGLNESTDPVKVPIATKISQQIQEKILVETLRRVLLEKVTKGPAKMKGAKVRLSPEEERGVGVTKAVRSSKLKKAEIFRRKRPATTEDLKKALEKRKLIKLKKAKLEDRQEIRNHLLSKEADKVFKKKEENPFESVMNDSKLLNEVSVDWVQRALAKRQQKEHGLANALKVATKSQIGGLRGGMSKNIKNVIKQSQGQSKRVLGRLAQHQKFQAGKGMGKAPAPVSRATGPVKLGLLGRMKQRLFKPKPEKSTIGAKVAANRQMLKPFVKKVTPSIGVAKKVAPNVSQPAANVNIPLSTSQIGGKPTTVSSLSKLASSAAASNKLRKQKLLQQVASKTP